MNKVKTRGCKHIGIRTNHSCLGDEYVTAPMKLSEAESESMRNNQERDSMGFRRDEMIKT